MILGLAAGIPDFFVEVALLIVFGALIAYIGYRLNLVPIVGFLLTGVVIGPNGLGVISEPDLVEATAQVGVILLLFTIGIEFSLDKLARIKNLVFGGGGLQVVLTSGITLGVLSLFGVPWQIGLFTGFMVALSSTAIVLKLLGSKGETNTEPGQASLGILIFQDLAIIVMVLLVPMLAGEAGSPTEIFSALGKAGLIIVVALFGARRIMPWLLERVARTCSQELFLLSLIAICFGMALLASLAGVSLELGAFLAGLIVSESRYSEHAFGEIMPLQILFAATFFVSVGMLLDLGFLFANLPIVLGVIVAVLVLKLFTSFISVRILGYSLSTSVAVGFILAQVGEFSFVLEKAGRELNLYPAGMAETGSKIFIAATVVLMVFTPLLNQLGMFLSKKLEAPEVPEEEDMPDDATNTEATQLPDEHLNLENHVVIAGYGYAARRYVEVLHAASIPHVVITLSPKRATEAENDGILVVRGDPTRQNALQNARLLYAKLLFIPDDDTELAHRVASVARTLNPTIHIIARTRFHTAVKELIHAGADHVITDEYETIVQLFAATLRDYQIDAEEIEHCAGFVRSNRYEVIRDASQKHKLAPIGDMIRGSLDTRTITIREGASIIGNSIESLEFEKKGLTIKTLHRNQSVVSSPPAHLVIKVDDMITFKGKATAFAQCAELFKTTAIELPPESEVALDESLSSPETGAASQKHIDVYGTDWCPLTGGFKGYFDKRGISYTYHDIEKDSSAEQAVKTMNGGKVKFPMVSVGERVMKNPPIDELEVVLTDAGIIQVEETT
ncbi:MAG: cation:proton antiporter [Rhodothermaceae bacterium]|nr:cation:proton antiporter [Rhodothermaceae bacterium]